MYCIVYTQTYSVNKLTTTSKSIFMIKDTEMKRFEIEVKSFQLRGAVWQVNNVRRRSNDQNSITQWIKINNKIRWSLIIVSLTTNEHKQICFAFLQTFTVPMSKWREKKKYKNKASTTTTTAVTVAMMLTKETTYSIECHQNINGVCIDAL